MPKYYCDYCDTHLTHDSPSVRKTHCAGRKHRDNVRIYYQKWMEEQAQTLIDVTTAAYKSRNMLTIQNGFMGQQQNIVGTMPAGVVPTGFSFNLNQMNSGGAGGVPGLATVGEVLPVTLALATCYPPPNAMLQHQQQQQQGSVLAPPVTTSNSVAPAGGVPMMSLPPPPQPTALGPAAATATTTQQQTYNINKNSTYNFPNITFNNGQQQM